MTGVHHFLNETQLDAVGQIGAEGSYHIVLDRSPPDYVEKISRYLSSSMGQGTWDKVSNGPAEAERDSGDSLFITQKEATVPEDVRPDRLHHYIRELEEGEGGSSSTSHSEDFKTPKWRRKKYTLPSYSFPFLGKHKKKLRRTRLPDQYKSLHNYTLGGFFKCLGELRQSSQRGQNLESSLPTVDMDGEHISPLSEEDGERSMDDVKVVERKHFLVSPKRTSQQTWCNQLKRQKRKKDNTAGPETSGETKMSPIKPNKKSSCRVLVQSAREASTPVTGHAGGGQPSQRLLHGLPDRSKVTTVKKKEESSKGLHAATSVNVVVEETPSLSEGYRAAQTSDVLGINVKNGTGALSGDNNTLRRVKGDIPDSKQRKNNKSAAERKNRKGSSEDAEQLQSGAVAEPQIDDDEIQKKRKGSSEDAEQLQSIAVAEPQIDDDEIQKKRKGSSEDAEQLQSGIVTEPQSDDAEIQKKKNKKKRKGSSEDAEQLQSIAVAEPQIDDVEIQKKKNKKKRKGSGEDAEQLQSGIVTEPQSDDAEIQKKKNKNKKKRKGSSEDAEQLQSIAVAEPQIDDVEIQKKKKKKKRKGSGKDAEQLQSGIVTEPQSDDAELQKKKRKGRGEDAEQLQSGAVAEPQIDDDEIQKKKKKKKKRKKELGIEIVEEQEEEETSNGTLDLPLMSTEQLEAAAPPEPVGSSLVKRKKRKKKQQSSDDATQDGEEGVDVSFCLEDSVTMAKGALKKKRITFFEETNVFHTPKEKFENASNQKTNEGLEDQIAESVTKKKKKKKEILSRGVSEDKVAQRDDSVSAREKGKKRHSSFLVADAEESCAQTRGISPPACRAGAGRKRKKERTGSEIEGLDSAADAELSANDEAAVLKKKKRKCTSVIIEGPPTATTCSSVSRTGKKGKCDAGAETLTSVECDLASSETLNDTRDQKKKKKTFQNEAEPGETRGKQRSEQPPVSPVTPEAPDILRKKRRKLKRKLLNPTVEFFSDS